MEIRGSLKIALSKALSCFSKAITGYAKRPKLFYHELILTLNILE